VIFDSYFRLFRTNGRRPETKSHLATNAGKLVNPPVLPRNRTPERTSFWEDQETELEEKDGFLGELSLIPFGILFTAGSQSIRAGYDAWKDDRDPGRHFDDRYLQAVIRSKKSKNSRLRQKSVGAPDIDPQPELREKRLEESASV